MERSVGNLVRRRISLAQLRTASKDLPAAKIRNSFLEYFCENNNHLHVHSCPVFSLKDPTLAFVNAGMNQFKDIFLGLQHPPSPRVANFQKCIRVGGKHNDLDIVGEDGFHHTFFEMLGNWSFGDYFKKEACKMAWELLTKVYQLQPERLYVTYFKGDKSLGLGPDLEVKDIWQNIGVNENHILPFGIKDNFWEGSVTGPCGPSTEIHYDHCSGRTNAGDIVNSGSNDLTELWNLVFTQYNRKSDGKLEKLNTHFVDTGMGFERLVAILQNKRSNYDTDLFMPLFKAMQKYTGRDEYKGKYDGNALDCGYRILADHSRMITVTLSDGMLPSNSGKLKRTLKKVFLVSEKIFGTDSGLLKELTNHVAESLSDAYPEIGRNLDKIHYIIESEENIFKSQRKMASSRWVKILKSYPSLSSMNVVEIPQILEGMEYVKKNILDRGKLFISGEDTWLLLDTLGVPTHVSQELALNLGLKFDMDNFKKYVSSLKTASRDITYDKFLKNRSYLSHLSILTELEKMKIEPSLDYFKHNYRTDSEGKYIFKEQSTTIKAVVFKNQVLKKISKICQDDEVGLVLDRTQLFSEEGGQDSDCGTLRIEKDIIFEIKKVINIKGFAVHFGFFQQLPSDSEISAGNVGVIQVNEERRLKLMQNHTALHLLNAALKNSFIGSSEKFSEVKPEKLHLNFIMYNKKIDKINDIQRLEDYVNHFIFHGVYVKRKFLNQSEFHRFQDVAFVPGDFILDAEIPIIEINSGFNLSREYCKGAHVLNTSEIKDFIITNHSQGKHSAHSIEAVTGDEASKIRKTDSQVLKKWNGLEESLSANREPIPAEFDDLTLRIKSFEFDDFGKELSLVVKSKLGKKIEEAKKKLRILQRESVRCILTKEILEAFKNSTEQFVVHCLNLNPEFLEELEVVIEKSLSKPLILFTKLNERVAVVCFVPQEYVSGGFNAKIWIQNSVTFGGFGYFKKKQSSSVMYYLKERKFSEDQLLNSMKLANEFAKKNITREVIDTFHENTEPRK